MTLAYWMKIEVGILMRFQEKIDDFFFKLETSVQHFGDSSLQCVSQDLRIYMLIISPLCVKEM